MAMACDVSGDAGEEGSLRVVVHIMDDVVRLETSPLPPFLVERVHGVPDHAIQAT